MDTSMFKPPQALSYKGNSGNWQKFKQQFQVYMKATGLDKEGSERKVSIFLNIAGEEALDIYNSLQLTDVEKQDFDTVLESFEDFCTSNQNVIYKSFKFFTRAQRPGEAFMDFYNDLILMADFCSFGNQRDRLIRDRIVAGMKNAELQEMFLKAPDLSLEEVVDMCIRQEVKKVDGDEDQVFEPEPENNNNHENLTNNSEPSEINEIQEFIQQTEHSANTFETNLQVLQNADITNGDNSTNEIPEQPESNESSPKRRKYRKAKNNVATSNFSDIVLQRRRNAEAIQVKIEEIKKKLRKAIKSEQGNEQQKPTQKYTRSVRKLEIIESDSCDESESEPSSQIFQDNDAVVYDDGHQIYNEEETADWAECNEEDDPLYKSENNFNDNHVVNGHFMNAVEDDSEEWCSSPKEKKPTKEKNEGKIITVVRDDLPPLIIKTIKKKTLLLGKMPYPCKKCDESFWTSVQLDRHQLVHVLKKVPPPTNCAPKKIFKCEECGKQFKKICDLERHTRVHTGEKPSVCNICNKRFQQAYNLNKHLLIHTQEKKFECVICQKKFGRNDVLNRHVLTHSIEKPFHCSLCSKTFIRNMQLNIHLQKHHNVTPEATTSNAKSGEEGESSNL